MAYANNYTYMYGFSLLDDLHNFFPELLYDETLFPDQRFGWFRHRTSTLFPSVFSRQLNMYRIYNAAERQNMFTTWVNSQAIGIQTQPPPVPAPVAPAVPSPVRTPAPAVPATTTDPIASIRPIATLRYAPSRTYSQAAAAATATATAATAATPATVTATYAATDNTAANILMRMALDETAIPQTPQRAPSAALPNAPARRAGVTGRATQLGSDIDILTALLTVPTSVNARTVPLNPLNTLFGTNDLLSLLTNSMNFQDVLVIPTLNQIEAASRIIEHADIGTEENCAICQEHTIPGQQSPWRRLHCSHQFHTSCIMPWFQRDVHCPVCRADIRDLGPAADHDDQSDMSTSTETSEETQSTTQPQR